MYIKFLNFQFSPENVPKSAQAKFTTPKRATGSIMSIWKAVQPLSLKEKNNKTSVFHRFSFP
jgi:hypothetical protein